MLNNSSNTDDLDSILKKARSNFWDAKYYDAISSVERVRDDSDCENDILSANVCLCVFFDFLNDTQRYQSIKRELMHRASWSEENFKDALMMDILHWHSGNRRAVDRVREKLFSYCEENLQISQPSFDTYFCKAWIEKGDNTNWILFLDKAIKCAPERFHEILNHVQREIYRERHRNDKLKLLDWLSELENQSELCVLLQGQILAELGEVGLSIAKLETVISGVSGWAQAAKRKLIELYCQQRSFEKALQVADTINNFRTPELATIFLKKGDAKAAKEVLVRDEVGRDRTSADLFLRFDFYDEALEVFYRMQPFSDCYPYYTAALAMWKKALKNGISDETVSYLKKEMLPAVVYGKYLEQRIHHVGLKAKLSDMELHFELMEARFYFVVNLVNIKRSWREIREGKIDSHSSFSISHYAYRDRLTEIYREIKRRGANPSERSRDFRARNYDKTFLRAINLLERLSQRVLSEISKVERSTVICNASSAKEDLWSGYWLYFEEQDYKKCLEILTYLADLEPESPFIHQERARTLKGLGRYEEAIELLKKAISLFGKYHERSASAHNLLQHVYADMIDKSNLTAPEKNDVIAKLNNSFESWFKADISLFGKLSEPLPEIGLRGGDPVLSINGSTLYKYCSFNLNSVSALGDYKVYFSRADQLNDPFDMDGYRNVITGDEFVHVSDEAQDKVTCFCTTLRHDNLQMWAHYADAFAGMCIGYQISKLPSEIGWRSLRYPENKTKERALVDTLFIKSADWSYEQEVRFLRFSEGPQLVRIHPMVEGHGIVGHVSEIILGSRFDYPKNWPVLRAIVKSLNDEYSKFSLQPVTIMRAGPRKSEKSDALEIDVADDLSKEVLPLS
ncbi:lipopolysaccharide assembly protein LapB [Thalassospira sp. MCCC 1A03138]|uniref:tetratricopeptide repeat protein n=1 Tax=Thalassospira sp. MCCC 1A03138 TaxID=1470576 RepID=UPI000A1F1716|nr:DUF2971 domain-containing protein [Thalassospira sp. MCCC 1A03138]OSQ27662.1 hypothetical protein TH468_20100 [Thalassospira sp. MCCC 1A03138]